MTDKPHIQVGTIYWGKLGKSETWRKVLQIQTRESGTAYVQWVTVKRDYSLGNPKWSKWDTFRNWVQGVLAHE
ncbi:hypothetical protein ACFQ5D_17960 [Paenibacillus farraposensis]|uniref:Uncharacterized protein n=1 Tax=Paenibacillus farraposensis TaxID=2807095 RepID=A0ABW4DHS4_9BACL|nr:hypothetical protein [Paenibacillus farraposensis]MCC3381917.1 hypothetical protein [Paenibacillus farraposensis]